jgi:hypothetical protein
MIQPADFDELIRLYPPIGEMTPAAQRLLRENLQRATAPAQHVLFDLDSPCSLFLLLLRRRDPRDQAGALRA